MTSWDGGGEGGVLSFYLLLYILSFYLFYPITHDICIYKDILNVNKTFIIIIIIL